MAEKTEERLLTVQEVACLIGSSIQTINLWYKWKLNFPDHERAKMLPDFIRRGNKNTRYWRQEDVWKLIEFKQSIPQGKRGVMGEITQQYVKKTGKRHGT